MAFTALRRFGVRLELTAPEALIPLIAQRVPEEADELRAAPRPGHDPPEPRAYTVTEVAAGRFDVAIAGRLAATSLEQDAAVHAVQSDAKFWIAATAIDVTFVHAGVVGLGDGAILVPGASRAGKTSLVMALLERGASYFSDDFAIIDDDGRVWPFPLPLNVRSGASRSSVPAPSMSAHVADAAAPVAGVLTTTYRADSIFRPIATSRGMAALRLAQNAPAIQLQPARTLVRIRAAVAGTRAFEGDRGDAGTVANWLLETYRSRIHLPTSSKQFTHETPRAPERPGTPIR